MSQQTMAQKVLARAAGRNSTQAGEYVTAKVDRIMAHEAFSLCVMKLMKIGVNQVFDPEKVIVILDHYFPAPTQEMAAGHLMARSLAKSLGIKHFLGHAGICHQVLTERGLVRPGHLVFGTDSHSTTYGAIGAAGTGLGLTEISYAMATGELWLQVPPTIRFVLEGQARAGLMSKDVILHIAGKHGTEAAQYRSIEFAGDAAERMTIASRMTMSNMGVEIGAKFAFFAADSTTCDYLFERTGENVEPFGPDTDPEYEETHIVDVAELEPQVARPHSPGNVAKVSDLRDVPVAQAFIGSCTNARLEDFEVAAKVLAGRRVHAETRLIVTPASQDVHLEATKAGFVQTLLEAGAHVTASGCGACPGGHNGVVGPGEACISSTNRNFRGRMGSTEAEIYLASPATVAASAITGKITDPRDFWDGTTL